MDARETMFTFVFSSQAIDALLGDKTIGDRFFKVEVLLVNTGGDTKERQNGSVEWQLESTLLSSSSYELGMNNKI